MWFACTRRLSIGILGCLIIVVAPAVVGAATLTWTGRVDSNWFTNVDGVTNWLNESEKHVVPLADDNLVFTASGIYSGSLTLAGLAGGTIAINSITVGVAGNSAQSLFSPDQVFAGEGTIQLGTGGLTVYLPGAADGDRNVYFNTDFQLSDGSFVQSRFAADAAGQRQVHLNGQISGGSASHPITVELSSPDGGAGDSKAIVLANPMPDLYGALKLNGTVYCKATDGAIWGNESTTVHLSSGGETNVYAFKAGGDLVVPNDIVLQAGRTVLLSSYQADSTWTLSGDITGGSIYDPLDLLGDAGAGFVFAGANQTFSHCVWTRSGIAVVLAGAGDGGVVWPNVPEVLLKFMDNCPGRTSLLLQGDYTLNAPITLNNVVELKYRDPVLVGQVNDGLTAYEAAFNRKIKVLEDDYQILQLTADADGKATFNGEINVVGGNYGFDKVGAGTVVVNGRVSQSTGDTLPIGDVNVQQGTLLVNNPGGTDAFHASRIQVANGAELGGSGVVTGNVVLNSGSVLGPGSDVGTFTINGNAYFSAHSVLEMHLDGAMGDRLDITGLLDLSGPDDTLRFEVLAGGAGPARILASYGLREGEFEHILNLPSGYDVVYNYLGGNYIALVAPEPSGLLLLSVGVLGIGWYGRRQRRRQTATA
ncbi:MAG: PEP-CTERM sorting domain-containing protein [Rhodopirellula sp.]|nr:PEP-CTERM sorting domain-containing protein [Rhodopirellula sp.]